MQDLWHILSVFVSAAINHFTSGRIKQLWSNKC